MGYDSFGAILKYGSTPVAKLKTVDWDGPEATTLDVTHHQSPYGWSEFIAGIKDAGSINFTALMEDDTSSTLYAQFGILGDWDVEFTTGETFTCKGILSKFSIDEAAIDNVMTCSGTIKLSGKPTWES